MYGENGIFGSPLVTSLGTLFYFLVFGTFFSNCGGDVLIDGVMKPSDKTVGGPANALKCGRTDAKNSGVVVIKNELRYYIIVELYASVSRA